MIVKIIFSCVIFGLALANEESVQNRTHRESKDTGLHTFDKDNALESSIFGILILTIAKTVWTILSTVWSIAAYKLATLAVATKTVIWVVKNGLPVVIGGVLVYGFCFLTDSCNLNNKLDYLPQGLIPIYPSSISDEKLALAEMALEKGVDTYEDNAENVEATPEEIPKVDDLVATS